MKVAITGSSGLAKNIKDITDSCEVCKKTNRRHSKPKTCAPRARSCNEVVSIDLKKVGAITGNSKDNRQIVYIMDEFSRFIVGSIVKSKEPKDVIKPVINEWCLKGVAPMKVIVVRNTFRSK